MAIAQLIYVPPVRTSNYCMVATGNHLDYDSLRGAPLGAGVECGRKGWIWYAETDLVRRNPLAGLRLYRNLGYLPRSTSVFKVDCSSRL